MPSRLARAPLVVAALVVAALATTAWLPRTATAAQPSSPQPAGTAPTKGAGEVETDPSRPANVGFSTVPKVYALLGGWAWNFKSRLPNRDGKSEGSGLMGAEVIGDWLWQVGGFRSRWPSWVGFYLGWIHFPGQGEGEHRTRVLEYGLRIRHAFRATETVRPFITYCLGATQVWVDGVAGRGITHQTRGGLGVDVKIARRLRLVVEAGWRMQSLPALGSDADQTYSSTSVNLGVLYERPAK